MLLSRAWLSDYVDLSGLTAAELVELITTRIAEVDGSWSVAESLKHVRVARVTSLEKHPQRDGLQVAGVSTGDREYTVVCGAPDVAIGQHVVYAPVGTRLLKVGDASQLLLVEEREIAGVSSQGVLVSEAELGLSADHGGLLLLDQQLKQSPLRLGSLLSDYIGGPDTVIEIDNKSLTHRPDLWSHYGFARELSAILNRPVQQEADRFADTSPAGKELLLKLGTGVSPFQIRVEKESDCRRFSTILIEGVRADQSPLWMRRRLYSVGAGIRNILVDLSNYVMLDIGQPNHAYDADKLVGTEIVIRKGQSGEHFLGLDAVERALDEDDIVIADASGPIALGGVIGGGPSSIQSTTKRLLLESANFDPVTIRKTCKRHQLRTDASNRFEKSQSPYLAPLALHRFVALLREAQPEALVASVVTEDFPEVPQTLRFSSNFEYLRGRLGKQLSNEELASILSNLRFEVLRGAGNDFEVTVPYYRATRDISIADDLVEEIGRVHGYENIPEQAPLIESSASERSELKSLEDTLRDALCGMGLSESYLYSFVSPELSQRLGYPLADLLQVENPVDASENALRTSLIPGLMGAVARNSRFEDAIALFELGRAYEKQDDDHRARLTKRVDTRGANVFERRLLSVAYRVPEKWQAVSVPAVTSGESFYAVATILRRLARLVGVRQLSFRPLQPPTSSTRAGDASVLRTWMHPFRAAEIIADDCSCGVLAEVKPGIMDDVPSRTVLAELDLDLLLEAKASTQLFKSISKFPDSHFEISVVVDGAVTFAGIENTLRASVPEDRLRGLELLSVYRGKPLAENEKSISLRLSFGAADRTLDGEELRLLQETVVAAIARDGYRLRS